MARDLDDMVGGIQPVAAQPNKRLYRSRRIRCFGLIQRACADPVNLDVCLSYC